MKKKRKDDCLRQCVARIVRRKPHRVPHFVKKYKGRWVQHLAKWCDRIGYNVLYIEGQATISEGIRQWINIGPSASNKKLDHAVVMRAGPHTEAKVVYDGGNGIRKVTRVLVILKK